MQDIERIIQGDSPSPVPVKIVRDMIDIKYFPISFIKPIYIRYWAPASSIKSYSNSAVNLPYPSESIAFQGTKNMGVVRVRKDGRFEIPVNSPGSYYDSLMKYIIKPHIRYQVCDYMGKPLSEVYIKNI
jgi:hypothetical protein